MLNREKFAVRSQDLKGEGFEGFPGFILRRVIDPESGGSAHFRMSLVTLEAAVGTPRHVHHDSDEAWYILSGEGIFYADGRKTAFKSGDFLFVHKDAVHQLINTGAKTLTYLAVTAPPCDFERDNHVVEAFDPHRHSSLAPEPTR